jgi:sugar lactone lactonase YvrE
MADAGAMDAARGGNGGANGGSNGGANGGSNGGSNGGDGTGGSAGGRDGAVEMSAGDPAPVSDALAEQAAADAAGSDLGGGDGSAEVAPAPPDTAPDVSAVPPGCGTTTANIAGIKNADGVVVDTDGTIYFLTDDPDNSYVGRILPGGKPDIQWLTVFQSPTTWGLALDSPGHRLYVLVVDGGGGLVVYNNIKSGSPVGSTIVNGITNGNDVAVASNGVVYYTQQSDRMIYSVSPSGGAPKLVTKQPLGVTSLKQAPAALAFTPDGKLLVGLEHGGSIYSITLTNGVESARDPLPFWTGWANGMTFDRRGQLYISMYDDVEPRSVVRLESDGRTTPILNGGRFSSIAFGRGPLDCRDLYVADPYGPMQVQRVPDSL